MFVRHTVSVVLWAVLVIVLMVAAAYLWVWVYATFVNASGDDAYYQAYAQRASPIVAIVTAYPVFYLMGRFMRRYGETAWRLALIVIAINLFLDVLSLLLLAENFLYTALCSVLALVAKVSGARMGVRVAAGDG